MNTRISGFKHFSIYLSIVILLGAGGWSLYHFRAQLGSKTASHQIQGQLSGATAGNFNVYGTHVLDANPEGSDFKNPVVIKVNFDSHTKFVKTTWLNPTNEDYANYKPPLYARQADNPQAGSLNDLKNARGTLLAITTAEDTYNKNEVTATEIDYALPTRDKGYSFHGRVTKVEGNNIYVTGTFSTQGNPDVFMSQGPSTVTLTISSATKLTRVLIPGPTPSGSPIVTVQPPAPAEVTMVQFAKDFLTYKNIAVNVMSSVNIFGSRVFAPVSVMYPIVQAPTK